MKRVVLLGLLALSLFAINLTVPVKSASAAYWCPPYTRYCSTNAQCRGYCGPGVPASWEICSQGCCACLG
jgi:hypothetical protein